MKILERFFVHDRDFYRSLVKLALPIVMQSVITVGIGLTDTIMLGVFGEVALSASSLANQFFFIFQILHFGIGGGAAVLTAQFWGRGEILNIKKTLTLVIRLSLICTVIFTTCTLLFPEQIMSFYSQEADIIEAGAAYLRVLAASYLFSGLSFVLVILLRSIGTVKLAMVSTIISFFTNIFLNWVFMFGKFGFPAMEIRGAALGTVFSRIIEVGIIIVYMLRYDKKVIYKLKDLFLPVGELIQPFIKRGLPVIISDFFLTMGNNMLAMIMGRMGRQMVSANSITTVVVQLTTVFTMALSNASSVMTGNVVGRGERERAQEQGITFLWLSVLIGIASGVVILIISPFVVNFYNVSDETKLLARGLMNMIAYLMVFRTVGAVLTKGVLRGGGDTRFLMLADVLFLWLVSVPLGYAAAFFFHWPPTAVYLCIGIDFIIKSVWCAIRLYGGKWIKVIKVEAETEV